MSSPWSRLIESLTGWLDEIQRLVEWSDNHTVAKSLRRKGSTMERLVTSLGEAL
jgi:hypothetical protein